MMLEEHLACPKCGYDLHGIPEVRCPECGFRYDAAALRSMAVSAAWLRLVTARDLIVQAAIAAALVVPAACDRLGVAGWADVGVSAGAYVGAFLAWMLFTDAYRGLASVPHLVALFAAAAVGFAFVVASLPVVALGIGVANLVFAWFIRLRDWSTSFAPTNVGSAELRRSAAHHSLGGMLVLIAASLLVLIALSG